MNLISIITVVFVWILIALIGFSYCTLFLAEMYYQVENMIYQKNKKQFYGIILTLLPLIMIGSISYMRAIITSPGYVQKNEKLKYEDKIEKLKAKSQRQKQQKKQRNKNNFRLIDQQQYIKNLLEDSYCDKCQNVKLSRVHHCKVCQTCIIRMDHHCPWVGNCIGKFNHKYFFLFLFYKTISLLIVFATIFTDYAMGEIILSQLLKQNQLYYYLIILIGIMSIFLVFAIGFMFITQLIIIVQNVTTLQSFYDGIFQYNPFDTDSLLTNFKQIMGESIWFLPTDPFPQHFKQINVAFQ